MKIPDTVPRIVSIKTEAHRAIIKTADGKRHYIGANETDNFGHTTSLGLKFKKLSKYFGVPFEWIHRFIRSHDRGYGCRDYSSTYEFVFYNGNDHPKKIKNGRNLCNPFKHVFISEGYYLGGVSHIIEDGDGGIETINNGDLIGKIVFIIGLPGSGKSTFIEFSRYSLEYRRWTTRCWIHLDRTIARFRWLRGSWQT